MKPPAWLNETTELVDLLNQLIDKLDRQSASVRARPAGINLNEKTIPQLFKQDEDADHLWGLIKCLEEDHPILNIKLKKQRDPFLPEYTQAWLTLQDGGEENVRHWLQRPKGLSPLQNWRQVVEAYQDRFPGETEKLYARRITLPGREDNTMLAAFTRIAGYQHMGLSLRQLSSRCFWGDSKFLDSREELLLELYPDLQLIPRPVMVNIYIPETVNGILFIENQDNYSSAVAGNPAMCKNLVLVYVAGFKGSAARIRQTDGVSLHYHGKGCKQVQQQLEDWWFARRANDWPIWFWGDLDFSGMEILKVLKQRFAEINAWPPGYDPMLQLLQGQNGHLPAMADKQAQRDPGMTGCEYADTVLLPGIRQRKTFIDQEVVFDETVRTHQET